MMYLLGAITIGGVALAVYERRKNRRLTYDDAAQGPSQHSERQAFDKAEAIRTEEQFRNPPNSGF